MQGVRRPRKSLRVKNLREGTRTAAAGESRVEELQHLDVVGGLPQGVRAKEFSF
jgi:hypothetical protein